VLAAKTSAEGLRVTVAMTVTVETQFGPVKFGTSEQAQKSTQFVISPEVISTELRRSAFRRSFAMPMETDMTKASQDKNSIKLGRNLVEAILIEEGKSPERASRLTSHFLAHTVSPYISAIAEVQRIIDEIRKRERREVEISLISQNSPISLSLDGAAEAVGLVRDTVVPWRRKHAETMLRLLEQEKQAEIESKQAEVLEKRASATRGRAESEKLLAEAAKQHEEAEKIKLDNEKARLELYRARMQFALEVLKQVAPNLSETERIEYVVRLLPPLNTLVSSNLLIASSELEEGM
jgi:hypothetical protein